MHLLRSLLGILLLAVTSSPASGQLTHRYSFNDGTANDSVGTAHGVYWWPPAFPVVDGQFILSGGPMDYLELPAAEIGINHYSRLTFELWSTKSAAQGFSMTIAFGDTAPAGGLHYLMLGAAESFSRTAISSTGFPFDESGVNAPAYNDGLEHYHAVTVSDTALSYYIDGALIGTAALGYHTLSGVSTQYACLGRSVYSGDPLFQGAINEFRIWNQTLSAADIAAHFAVGPDVVPEPSALALLGLGIAVQAIRGRFFIRH